MSTTVTLEDRVAKELRRQAATRGLSLDDYLRALADISEHVLGSDRKSPHELSQAEFQQWLHDLPAGMPILPPLPADLSRADFYNDHD
jgi:hypothetical protein